MNPSNLPSLLLFMLTTGAASAQRTTLQKHVDFFFFFKDGFITVSETKESLDAMGFPGGSSSHWLTATAIHAGLPSTHGGGSIFQRLVIDTSIINRGIHPNDSDAYADDGSFVNSKFEAIFDEFDMDRNNAIDTVELEAFHQAKYETRFGDVASRAEWNALMSLAGVQNDDTGLMQLSRDVVGGVFDGSLFFQLEKQQNSRRAEEIKLYA